MANANASSKRVALTFIVILCLAGIAAWVGLKGAIKSQIGFKRGPEVQKGMCYVTWSKDRYESKESDESLAQMAKTGTTHVAITMTWYQESCGSTKIFPTEKTPTDASIIHAIQTAHALKMKVMLKPHLDLIETVGGSWRGEISCPTPKDWEVWFASYRDFIAHYARLAQANNVELFCVGTELSSVSVMKEEMWRNKIIAEVKKVYAGPLTYAANWNEEYKNVVFWDALDYIGIDAYFPLTEKDSPTKEELAEGWRKWAAEIEAFQAKVNKPVIFPETGYYSAYGTARMPWEENLNGKLDLELQADCYDVLFQTFWGKEWFYGTYWWRWGTDVRFGGPGNRGYSLQNKPAQDVVARWYKKPIPRKKRF